MPKICAAKCRDYLAVSDDIYSWFSEFYQTVEVSQAIPLTEIYDRFKDSEFWMNMTKDNKREYNRKYFIEQIEKNMFLRKYIKSKGLYHNKVRLGCDCIIGWELIPDIQNALENEPEMI